MPKKAHLKKKAFQRICRDKVKKDFINDASGGWTPYDFKSAMHKDQRAGYKLDR